MTEKYKIAVLSQGLLSRIVDLGDWSCRVGNLIQPIRSTTQIWVVTRLGMEFLRSFLRRHLV